MNECNQIVGATNATLSSAFELINLTYLLYWHCHICYKWRYRISFASFSLSKHQKKNFTNFNILNRTQLKVSRTWIYDSINKKPSIFHDFERSVEWNEFHMAIARRQTRFIHFNMSIHTDHKWIWVHYLCTIYILGHKSNIDISRKKEIAKWLWYWGQFYQLINCNFYS